ncbi:MAG: DUF559 domain-containing protein [Chloroflexi bacterium]|nr:DUF559 domain-containing protein [Chloroflexota bacterium]MCC6894251.1 DUF559 domain-containing protein [Anaerolineae bacterium]
MSYPLRRWLMIAVAVTAVLISALDLLNLLPDIAAKLTPLLIAAVIGFMLSESRQLRRIRAAIKNNPAASQTTAKPRQPNKKRQPNPQPEYRAIAWHGMTLRSHSEVKIAKALDRKGILFLADPKIRLDTENHRQTREVDFLIQHNGRWGILEVDGPHHQHSAAADQWRDSRFSQHGLVVVRFPADLCYRQPDTVVETFLQKLAVSPLPEPPPTET